MNTGKILLCALALLSAAAMVPAQSATKPPSKPAAVKKPTQPSPEERAFQNNCNRCHFAPEELNPRITGTVVRHMRVRANLSAEDERLIMSYLGQ